MAWRDFLYAYEFPSRWRNVSGRLFSLALILFGLLLIKKGSSELLTISWAATLFELIGDSGLIAFLTGTLLTLLAQSHIAIILLAIAMAQPGVYESEHIFMQVYGTYAGSAVLTYLLGASFKGVARQIMIAQALYGLIGAALFVGLFYSRGTDRHSLGTGGSHSGVRTDLRPDSVRGHPVQCGYLCTPDASGEALSSVHRTLLAIHRRGYALAHPIHQ